MRLSQLSRRGLATLAAVVAAITAAAGSVAVTSAVTSDQAAAPSGDLNGYVAAQCRAAADYLGWTCAPGSTTTTTIGGSTSSSSVSSSTTTTSIPTTTTNPTTTTVPPTTTTAVPATTTTQTIAPTTTTTAPQTTTTPAPGSQPNASNTGVPAGVTLTDYTGGCTVTGSGVVIDRKRISCPGGMTISGSNVTLSNFTLVARSFNGIQVTGSNVTIRDGEIDCSGVDSYGINVTGGTAAVMDRLDIFNCGNGIEPNNGSIIRASFLHNLKGSSQEHVDGISFDYGQDNVQVLGNTVDVRNASPGAVSALMVDNVGGGISGLVVVGNWFSGGQFTVYFDTQFGSGTIVGRFESNVLAGWVYGPCNRSSTKVTLDQTPGNTPSNC